MIFRLFANKQFMPSQYQIMPTKLLLLITSVTLLAGCGKKEVAYPASAPGAKTYKSTCGICHKSGLHGAPRFGNRDEWESRVANGNEILYERAIKGYKGDKGLMPARGYNHKLSDAEIREAVDFMVKYSMPAWTIEK